MQVYTLISRQHYNEKPKAISYLTPSPLTPNLSGVVFFYDVSGGTEVYVEVDGLPEYSPGNMEESPIGPHGFHIHEIGICQISNPMNPFQSAGEHWNPDNQPHGNHAGDFPVLFSNKGYFRMRFFTNRFRPSDIIGKSVVIHLNPDDYKSQPSGDAGKRIACGVIVSF